MAFVTDKYKQTHLQTEQQDSHLADAIDMKKNKDSQIYPSKVLPFHTSLLLSPL